jgi:spoIIIJ-associated protein
MSQEKTTLEVIAPTVEDAVQKGLSQLNLPQDAVEVEVLDAGSRGLFGLGSRQARIRLTIKTPAQSQPSTPRQPVQEAVPVVEAPSTAVETPPAETPVAATGEEEDETLRVSREVVTELLDKMKVRAKVTASYRAAEDESDEEVVLINVEGNDLSILIGRRSETLNALQYISSLIICKRLDRWIPLMIDVQGYRTRRERQLRQIAQRMAEQAIHTGRRQVLEPMPANERRLIHLELRDHPEVDTESVGEEPNRKVTIFPKK